MGRVEIRQAKDGRIRYRVRFRLNGMYTSQTFDTEHEAAEFIQLATDLGGWDKALNYMHRREGALADRALTLDRWFETYKATRTGIQERTLADYQRQYDQHISPILGNHPIGEIDRIAVAGFVNKLAAKRLSGKTIQNLHALLSGALNEAVLQRKIDTNPCTGTRLPRAKETERDDARFLTHDEWNRLIAAVPDFWKPLVTTLAGTGMRWSEATELRVGEVDLDGLPTIKIIRASKRQPGVGMVEGVPKSRKSRRTVIVPPQAADLIRPLLVGKKASDFVFLDDRGQERISHAYFHRRVWVPACDAAGLEPRPRPHDLRHTFASWALEMGIGLEAIQDQLGHESILTTRKVYGHLQPAMREALIEAMGRALAVGASGQPAIERPPS